MFPLDDNFIFWWYFFLWLIFFFGRGKKKYQPQKNISPKTKLLIQRKHLYAYDMTFLCHPSPQRKNFQFNIIFFFSLVDIFFLPKKTSLQRYFQLVTFHFIFHSQMQIAFFLLPIWTFRSFCNCEKHDFFWKTIETWYMFLIVLFFSKKT